MSADVAYLRYVAGDAAARKFFFERRLQDGAEGAAARVAGGVAADEDCGFGYIFRSG